MDADDSFSFHGEFALGGTCSVYLTLAAVGLKPTLEIYGAERTLVFDGDQLELATTSEPSLESLQLAPRISATHSRRPSDTIRGIHPQWKFYDEFSRVLSGEPAPGLPPFLTHPSCKPLSSVVQAKLVVSELRPFTCLYSSLNVEYPRRVAHTSYNSAERGSSVGGLTAPTKKEPSVVALSSLTCLAASYFPRGSRPKYHRRWRS